MAKVFNNEAELKKFLLEKCKVAVAETENKIYAEIKKTLIQYYQEFTPDEYIRTQQLLHSLVKSNIKKTAYGYEAEVYFDDKLMNYQKGVVPTQHGTGYATWGADEVLDTAMNGSHGGYIDGTAIWGTSRAILGDIYAILVQRLKAQGISVRKG